MAALITALGRALSHDLRRETLGQTARSQARRRLSDLVGSTGRPKQTQPISLL